jgi:hypothetical protein
MSGWKWKRLIEPCALTALYITGVMLLPMFFPCTPTECFIDQARPWGGWAAPGDSADRAGGAQVVWGGALSQGGGCPADGLPCTTVEHSCRLGRAIAPGCGGGVRGPGPAGGVLGASPWRG